jgi:flagellar assembly protein FliH
MQQNWGEERIERFEYPAMPFTAQAPSVFGLIELSGEDANSEINSSQITLAHHAGAKDTVDLEEKIHLAFAAGQERGFLEGRQMEREAHAAANKLSEAQRVQQMAKLIEQFAQERDRFLSAVEKEVVKLALAVAARILRREAQMDPLLLTGAVRVALGQLSGSTEARVRVPSAELDLWKDALALLPNLTIKPKVVAGEGMLLGDCMVETALGSVDLGIRSQLGEIERGFFDCAGGSKVQLPKARPATESAGSPA